MRGRRTPTEIKVLQGSLNTTRDKDKLEVEKITSIPEPPEFMSDLAKEFWYRQMTALVKLGLIGTMDITMFEIYCNEMARYWEIHEEMKKPMDIMERRTLYSMLRDAGMITFKIANQYGFTPASRTKIPSQIAKKDDIFEIVI